MTLTGGVRVLLLVLVVFFWAQSCLQRVVRDRVLAAHPLELGALAVVDAEQDPRAHALAAQKIARDALAADDGVLEPLHDRRELGLCND